MTRNWCHISMNIIKILIAFKYRRPTIVRYNAVIRFRKNVLYEIVLYETRNWRENSIRLATKWSRILHKNSHYVPFFRRISQITPILVVEREIVLS